MFRKLFGLFKKPTKPDHTPTLAARLDAFRSAMRSAIADAGTDRRTLVAISRALEAQNEQVLMWLAS